MRNTDYLLRRIVPQMWVKINDLKQSYSRSPSRVDSFSKKQRKGLTNEDEKGKI